MIPFLSIALLLMGPGIEPAVVCSFQAEQGIQATRDKLVGTWVGKVRIDVDGLKQNPFISKDMSDRQIQGVAHAYQLLASLKQQTLTFGNDGTVVNVLASRGKRQEKKGTWKLQEVEGKRLTVLINYTEDRQVVRMHFHMLEPDQLELELKEKVAKGITHRFTRQKPADK